MREPRDEQETRWGAGAPDWFSAWTPELTRDLLTALTDHLPAEGAALLLAGGGGPLQTVCASPGLPQRVENAQQTLGEGPAARAHATGKPFLVPDLRAPDDRWPVFTDAVANESGALFAFPLQARSVRLGVIDLYRDRTGNLQPHHLTAAVSASTFLAEGLLELSSSVDRSTAPLTPHTGAVSMIRRATELVSLELGLPYDTANVRIRAHAYASGLTLEQVLTDILTAQLVLER